MDTSHDHWTTAVEHQSGPVDPLLAVRDLKVHFRLGDQVVRAVDGVSFDLEAGRAFGLVGESGCGKSVLTRSVMRLNMPSHATVSGSTVFDGQDLSTMQRADLRRLWGRDIALVPQNPLSALNPVVKVGRQLTEHIRHHLGAHRADAARRGLDLLENVRIAEPRRCFESYPHQLSGGMRQRVCIAMAIACGARLLLADEPTTALDVTVQHEILGLLTRQQRERAMSMVLVTHDLGVVAGRTDETAVMYAGRIVEQAPTPELFSAPRHPYTVALLASIPHLSDPAGRELATIEGRPPVLGQPEVGCAFAARCPSAQPRCTEESPPLEPTGPGHVVACWYPAEAPVAVASPAPPRGVATSSAAGSGWT